MSDRPEWASGKEWEGWREHDLGGPMCRRCAGKTLLISARGWLIIDGSTFRCLSTAHALTAANAIAKAAGGWE